MLLPQQGQQDRGYLDHEQQYAQPSDHLAYRFWVPHKETDVGEEEAHGHVVDAGRELPAQDARDPRQPYCDEHRRRGPCVVPAQPSVLPPPTPALYHVPNPRSVSGSFASTHQFIHGAKVANRKVRGTETHRSRRSTATPTTGSAAKRPAEGWRQTLPVESGVPVLISPPWGKLLHRSPGLLPRHLRRASQELVVCRSGLLGERKGSVNEGP